MSLLRWPLILLIFQLSFTPLIQTQNNASTHGWNDARCGWSSVRDDGHRIINGENAQPGEFPWMAKIFFNRRFMCGASIINRHWLVTAAHCFGNAHNGIRLSVEVGTISFSNGQRFPIPWNRVFRHHRWSDYDYETHYDIALMKTQNPMPVGSNSINTVCLPGDYEEPRSRSVVTTGWGSNEYQDYPDILQKVTLDIISDQRCRSHYGNILLGELCTWTPRRDSCDGDSGGPSVEYRGDRAYLIGVTSYGAGCANEYPGVSTQVSHFMPWIKWVLSFNY